MHRFERPGPGYARAALAVCVATLCVVLDGEAGAVIRRPRFEPTDLEMNDPGLLELDLQFGVSHDDTDLRVVVPNFELNVGLFAGFELDLDGTVSLVRTFDPGANFATQIDNLWISTKVGLTDVTSNDKRYALSFGLQAGPRVAVDPAPDGVGYQGLLLVGFAAPRTHLVLNVGGFLDPATPSTPVRPVGVVVGLDLQVDLDPDGKFTILAEVFGTRSLGPAPDEYGGSLGLQYSPTEWLDLSLVGIGGYLGGGPSYGALLGVSPKFPLWHRGPKAP